MLEANGLMVFYENMLALNNVSIRCDENQIVGVFGANSAGKSTLMYTLSGIMEDIRKKEEMAGGERISVMGNITYLGNEIMGLKPSKRAKKGIVLCPERRRIFKVFKRWRAANAGHRACAHGPTEIVTAG
jgi:branched-chain amino acid transport system ATP-binding protein